MSTNTTDTTPRPYILTITRRFDAAPERVFDAWIQPETASRWFFTSPTSEANHTEIDARVGGSYTVTDTREGTAYTAIGEYLEVDRPRRLVFTFAMPQFAPDVARMIIEIQPDGDGCMLTLTQESQESLSAADEEATKSGWGKMFDNLAALLQRG